jgi:hypothetical protein
MNEPEELRDDPWHWLNWSFVLVFAGAVIMIILISAGAFDPRPIGELISSEPLHQVEVGEDGQRLIWLDLAAPGNDYTLRLTAALASGEDDSAYGLALGSDSSYLVAAFSPVGYVAFWQQDDGSQEKIVPWRTWPHVHPGTQSNELWLDVQEGRVTGIRTNGEILWQGDRPLAGGRIGLWAESFGQPASFDFQMLEVFARSGD